MTFLIVLLGWVFSLCLHEFSHAFVAYLGGDYTVREKGYLTFNPFKYTHPVYSLLLPLLFLVMGGIGLPGGAVYIETWRLRSKRWMTAVALSGPLSNLLLAFVFALALRFAPANSSPLWPGVAFLTLLQVMAVVLNLIPVPPFDGYGALEPHLSAALRTQIAPLRGAMAWIVFLALWYVPFFGDLFWWLVLLLARWMGIPLDLASLGYRLFRFWGQ
ncbi:MAG: site-2 protease family protein [Anaerolineales bacterium]